MKWRRAIVPAVAVPRTSYWLSRGYNFGSVMVFRISSDVIGLQNLNDDVAT